MGTENIVNKQAFIELAQNIDSDGFGCWISSGAGTMYLYSDGVVRAGIGDVCGCSPYWPDYNSAHEFLTEWINQNSGIEARDDADYYKGLCQIHKEMIGNLLVDKIGQAKEIKRLNDLLAVGSGDGSDGLG